MTRKQMIDTLKSSGRNSVKGKSLEDCYNLELLIAMRKQSTRENLRERG